MLIKGAKPLHIDKEAIKAWALKQALGSGDIDNDDTGYWSLDAENWG